MFFISDILLSGLFWIVIILVNLFFFSVLRILLIFSKFVLFMVVFSSVLVGFILVLIINENFCVLLLWVDILLFVLKVIFMFVLCVCLNVFWISGLIVVVFGCINFGKKLLILVLFVINFFVSIVGI